MFEANLLKDQVAVITGGGTGIGLAIAKRLGALGARIAIASRNAEHLEQGSNALRDTGVDALAVQLDVRNPEQVDEMVLRILASGVPAAYICIASRATSRQTVQPMPWASHSVGTPRSSRDFTKQSSLCRCPMFWQPQKHGMWCSTSGWSAANWNTATTVSIGRGGVNGTTGSSGSCATDIRGGVSASLPT